MYSILILSNLVILYIIRHSSFSFLQLSFFLFFFSYSTTSDGQISCPRQTTDAHIDRKRRVTTRCLLISAPSLDGRVGGALGPDGVWGTVLSKTGTVARGGGGHKLFAFQITNFDWVICVRAVRTQVT